MARYLAGAGTSAISGSVAGSTFTKNGQLRNKANPTNKRSQSQNNQRGSMTLTSQEFRELSQADQLAWRSAKGNFSVTDVFGNSIQLSGNALYNKLNQNLAQIGLPSISVPPNPAGGGVAPAFGTVTISAGGNQLDIAFSPSPVPVGFSVLLWATVGKSAGVKQVGSSYKLLSYLPAGEVTPYDAFADYTDIFGSLIIGTTIFFKFQSVNEATGETGSVQTISAVVAA